MFLSWEIHLRAVSVSVHREGVDPNSMEGVGDLDHNDDVLKLIFEVRLG